MQYCDEPRIDSGWLWITAQLNYFTNKQDYIKEIKLHLQ